MQWSRKSEKGMRRVGARGLKTAPRQPNKKTFIVYINSRPQRWSTKWLVVEVDAVWLVGYCCCTYNMCLCVCVCTTYINWNYWPHGERDCEDENREEFFPLLLLWGKNQLCVWKKTLGSPSFSISLFPFLSSLAYSILHKTEQHAKVSDMQLIIQRTNDRRTDT